MLVKGKGRIVGREIYVSRGLESIVKRGDHDSQPSPFGTPRRVRDEDYASRHEHRADTRSSVFIPLINANDSQPSSKRFRCAPSRVTPRWTLAVLSKIYRSSDVNVPVDSNFQICQPILRCLSRNDRSGIISSVSSSRDTTRYVETRIWHRTALYGCH